MLKQRLYMGMLAVGISALMVGGVSFALFSATTTNTSNTFTSGTVALGAPATTMANVTDIAPGDSGSETYAVQYTGSLNAWLGLDFSVSGPLTTCDGGGKFTAYISDGASNYSSGVNQVLGLSPVSTGAMENLVVNWGLDLNAGNDCQAKSAQVSITVHATQSANNTNGGGTGPISWN